MIKAIHTYSVIVSDEGFCVWSKALFNSLPPEDYKDGVLVLGGDGRYFNKEAAQVFNFNVYCRQVVKFYIVSQCFAPKIENADNYQNCCW